MERLVSRFTSWLTLPGHCCCLHLIAARPQHRDHCNTKNILSTTLLPPVRQARELCCAHVVESS
jgi:cell division FtsZ-interacting protein ZapD